MLEKKLTYHIVEQSQRALAVLSEFMIHPFTTEREASAAQAGKETYQKDFAEHFSFLLENKLSLKFILYPIVRFGPLSCLALRACNLWST